MQIPQQLSQVRLVYYPNPILREVCVPIDQFGPELQALADHMHRLMLAGKGVGLACPQVGLLLRMFVCNPTGEPGDAATYVNPVLDELTDAVEGEEGCLSLPGVAVPVRRARRCRMRAFAPAGNQIERHGEELEARVWQHETDHLHARLIIDHQNEAARIANRRALQQLKDDYQKPARM